MDKVTAILPARDEADAIEGVIHGLQQLRNGAQQALIDRIIVCDNGSRDKTGELASAAGAEVVHEPQPGYGAACLRALSKNPEDKKVCMALGAAASQAPAELRSRSTISSSATAASTSQANRQGRA